jgi:predicted house-cleaning noncanonical NTP pyrophosphatase (MazG superfamily)
VDGMDKDYVNALADQLTEEVKAFGEEIQINGNTLYALVSQSATTKNLQVAGFYKNQVLDVVIPLYVQEPAFNHIVLYSGKTYQVKTIENLEYKSGYRLTIELVP